MPSPRRKAGGRRKGSPKRSPKKKKGAAAPAAAKEEREQTKEREEREQVSPEAEAEPEPEPEPEAEAAPEEEERKEEREDAPPATGAPAPKPASDAPILDPTRYSAERRPRESPLRREVSSEDVGAAFSLRKAYKEEAADTLRGGARVHHFDVLLRLADGAVARTVTVVSGAQGNVQIGGRTTLVLPMRSIAYCEAVAEGAAPSVAAPVSSDAAAAAAAPAAAENDGHDHGTASAEAAGRFAGSGTDVHIRAFPKFSARRRDVTLGFRSKREARSFVSLVAPAWLPERFAVVLNCWAGKRQGRKIFERAAEVFRAAGVELDVFETTHPNYGYDWALQADVSRYDGIVSVSGDSTLTEIINGFHAREDREQCLRVPMGLLAAGSSNGIMVQFQALNEVVAALRIVRGTFTSMDVMWFRHGSHARIALNNLGFGLLGELNGFAEEWTAVRKFGPARYVCGALRALCCFSGFRCRMKWIERSEPERPAGRMRTVARRIMRREQERGVSAAPAVAFDDNVVRPDDVEAEFYDTEEKEAAAAEEEEASGGGGGAPRASAGKLARDAAVPGGGVWVPAPHRGPSAPLESSDEKGKEAERDDDASPRTPRGTRVAVTKDGEAIEVRGELEHDGEWKACDAEVANVMLVSFKTPFTPKASMSDGLMDLAVAHHGGGGCCQVLGTMAKMGLGKHDGPRVEVAQIKRLRLEGISPDTARLNLDGEVLHVEPNEAVDVTIWPAYFVFMGGW